MREIQHPASSEPCLSVKVVSSVPEASQKATCRKAQAQNVRTKSASFTHLQKHLFLLACPLGTGELLLQLSLSKVLESKNGFVKSYWGKIENIRNRDF